MEMEGDWNTTSMAAGVGVEVQDRRSSHAGRPGGALERVQWPDRRRQRPHASLPETWRLESGLGLPPRRRSWAPAATSGRQFRRSTTCSRKPGRPRVSRWPAFAQEAVGNVVDWPNTPGMNQALTDMQTSMKHNLVGT